MMPIHIETSSASLPLKVQRQESVGESARQESNDVLTLFCRHFLMLMDTGLLFFWLRQRRLNHFIWHRVFSGVFAMKSVRFLFLAGFPMLCLTTVLKGRKYVGVLERCVDF